MEPRHIKTHMTATCSSELLPCLNWYCSVFHFLTPDAQIRPEQYAEVTADGTKVSGVDDLVEGNAHISVTWNGRLSADFFRINLLVLLC